MSRYVQRKNDSDDSEGLRPVQARAKTPATLVEDFLRLADQFRSALPSAQRDAASFMEIVDARRPLDDIAHALPLFGVERLLGRVPTNLNAMETVWGTKRWSEDDELVALLEDPDRAKLLYVDRCAMYYGGRAAQRATVLVVEAVHSDLLNLPPKVLARFKEKTRPFIPRYDREKLRLFWQEVIVPLLKRLHGKQFRSEAQDFWGPMRDSEVACRVLAKLIANDPHAPYMPARWFRRQYGITAERLRSARIRGKLTAIRSGSGGQYRYSVPDARGVWPLDEIELP